MNHLRFAIRQIVKNPAISLVAVLTLALGIGSTSIVFCWIQSVLLRPFPGVSRPEQLVVLCAVHGSRQSDTVSLPDLKDYRGLTNVFAGIIGSQITPACIETDSRREWAYGQIVTANFFDVLGVRPVLGRFFRVEEDSAPGGAPILVLSHSYWSRRFASDPGVIGKTVEVNRRPFTIVGVAAPGFRGTMSGLTQDFWAPLVMHEVVANFGDLENRGDNWLHVIARLQPGVDIGRAQVAASALAHQLEAAFPDTNRERGLRILPPYQSPWGGQAFFLPVLRALLVVSLGVLVIVIANVANLLLARALGRQKEVAIRLAVGAGRRHLLHQLLTESLVLAAFGGGVGLALTYWGRRLFELFMPRTYLPIGYAFDVNWQTVLFTLGLTLVTGLLFGLAPVWQALRTDLHSQLKEGGRTSSAGTSHLRVRGALVVLEIALALVLLAGAGLCLKGFQQARRTDAGFDPQNCLLAGMRLGAHGYDEASGKSFYRKLQQRLEETPGVESAALASWFPLGFEGGSGTSIVPEGYQRAPNEDMSASYAIVSPGYFETMRIPILEGRDFTFADEGKDGERVAILNETAAKRFWPGESAVGKRFHMWWEKPVTVVGVVKTGRYRSLSEPARPFLYMPHEQGVWDLNLGVILRTQGRPEGYAKAIREAVKSIDSGVEVWTTIAYSDYMQAAYLAHRIAATLLAVLGVTALFLAALGIYGVVAYFVSQRTHEIGVRMALGADLGRVLALVLINGARLALFGVVLGLLGALLLSRLISSFLHGVNPYDPLVLGAAAASLAAVSLLASAVPAWRAARVDPIVALRES